MVQGGRMKRVVIITLCIFIFFGVAMRHQLGRITRMLGRENAGDTQAHIRALSERLSTLEAKVDLFFAASNQNGFLPLADDPDLFLVKADKWLKRLEHENEKRRREIIEDCFLPLLEAASRLGAKNEDVLQRAHQLLDTVKHMDEYREETKKISGFIATLQPDHSQ